MDVGQALTFPPLARDLTQSVPCTLYPVPMSVRVAQFSRIAILVVILPMTWLLRHGLL
jgi:hypothetical protein